MILALDNLAVLKTTLSSQQIQWADYLRRKAVFQWLLLSFFFGFFLLFRLLSSGSLVIISPTVDDTAVYECSVSNAAGEDQRAIDLTVQGIEDIAITFEWHPELLWGVPMLR